MKMKTNTTADGERRLTHCARCGEDAGGDKGRPMFGIVVDDLGAVPVFTIIRTLGKNGHLFIRLRICHACDAEAVAFAASAGAADRAQPLERNTRSRAAGDAKRK